MRTFCIYLIFVCSIITSYTQDNCDLQNQTFQSGEQLTYKIYYKLGFIWMPVGEAHFSIYEDGGSYFAEVIGRTYKAYNLFFEIKDVYRSVINQQTLLPTQSVRHVHQGKYNRYDSTEYLPNDIINYYGRSPSKLSKSTKVNQGCMSDMLSILYYIRNIDLNNFEIGSVITAKVFFDKILYELDVEFLGRETVVKASKQKHNNSIKISSELVEGHVFKPNSKMIIWISNDINKVPLKIESPLRVGSVKAILKSHKNLIGKLARS